MGFAFRNLPIPVYNAMENAIGQKNLGNKSELEIKAIFWCFTVGLFQLLKKEQLFVIVY